MKIVLADSNGTHFKWLQNLRIYLIQRGFSVNMVAGWDKPVKWWEKKLEGASLVFVWNGAHPVFQPVVKACKKAGIPLKILEVAWFPQKKYYFLDPTGINCRSSIMSDDLKWVGDRQFERLEKLKISHLKGKVWKGGGKVLAPLQLESDMNWVLDGGVGSMQDFIDHVQDRFGKENVIFKRHPKDKRDYMVHNIEKGGDLLDMISEASLVYGVNSTSLLEAALMGAPVKSVGGGYLRGHEGDVTRLLAALADKQVPVEAKNVDYWFADVLSEVMEGEVGHSEAPWGPLSNSAIVIVPCRNCERFVAECLDSVRTQTWKDVGVIVVDDCSDDDTAKVARESLKGIDHLVIRNSYRRWALRNIDTAISGYCENEDSVIFLLDGDDYLIDEMAVEKMMSRHEKFDVVWSDYRTDVKGWRHNGRMIDSGSPLREQPWHISPFRSFKKFLFDEIDRKEFLDLDGQYFKVTWDQAIMFPIVEMSPPDKWCFVDERLYYYRMHDANDHAVGVAEQKRAEEVIRKRGPARRHARYQTEMSVVVSCYNQLHVLPMFLESMSLQYVLPKRVIVADDGSSDGVCEWVDEHAGDYSFELYYVSREHKGYRLASLDNAAGGFATGKRVLFTNADVLHCQESIGSHMEKLGVGGGVVKGVAMSKASIVDIGMVRDFNKVIRLQEEAPSGRHNLEYISKTDPKKNPIGVWGGNFSVPLDKFKEVGGFDEGFKGWGGEDNELVERLASIGCEVSWVMDSVGYHLDHEKKGYVFDQNGSKYYAKRMI